jgi:predicted transposase/invertase (TIGR01784 family)
MPEIMDWLRAEGIEIGMERGLEKGVEKGVRATKLEDARKMREHGIAWEIITDVTGIKPEELPQPQ